MLHVVTGRRATGTGFGRLWIAATVGNLGDGIGRVAIALLAAGLTRDPLAVAAVTALSYLPWLLLGLPAGVLVDRYDRRRLAVGAGALRAAAIAALTVAAALDSASLWLLYTAVLLLYTAETAYDNSVMSMVPMVIARDELERANGRLQGGVLIAEQFIGPSVAGIVFSLAAAYAFGINVACYLVAVVLLLAMPGSYRAARTTAATSAERRRSSIRQEMVEGLRYVWGHALHRSLLGLMMAIGFGGAMVTAINVLWALDVLGMSEPVFGLFILTMAVGALAGSQTAAPLARRAGRGRTLRLTVLATGAGAVTAAATTSSYVAGLGLVVVGWAGLVFNVVNVSLRQRLTPASMLGRVMGTYRAISVGIMVAGAFAGGAVARFGGLRLPWLVVGVGALLLGLLVTRRLANEVVDRAVAEADARPATDQQSEAQQAQT